MNWWSDSMRGPDVVEEFERAVADYCGAPYAVATTSCTKGIFLALMSKKVSDNGWNEEGLWVELPTRTYVGVAMSAIHAGYRLKFRDYSWAYEGCYRIGNTNIWDCARIFASQMYTEGSMMVTSHHWNKPLGLSQGGVILLDDIKTRDWLVKARFDGRTPGVAVSQDKDLTIGWHAYMSPEVAAMGLQKMMFQIPADTIRGRDLTLEYPDISKFSCFDEHIVEAEEK